MHSDLKGVSLDHSTYPSLIILKSNILVNEFGVPMITSFGSARTLYSQSFMCTTTLDAKSGTLRWTAHELLLPEMDNMPECDESDLGSELEETEPGRATSIHDEDEGLAEIANSEHASEVGDLVHTKETDIWAFGMVIYVCYEIYSFLREH